MIVIADTTPLNYLALIDRVEVLPQLYSQVLIPLAVWEEFQRPETAQAVCVWIAQPPAWLQIRPVERTPDLANANLGAGSVKPSRWLKNST
jgi:predicted nucleic acid-binding protein